MTEQEEKALVERVNNSRLGIPILSDEQIEVCKKYNVDPSKYKSISVGKVGSRFTNKERIGAYITGKGYYKIVDIKQNFTVPDGRTYEEMLVTNYSKDYTTNFYKEEVLINPRPLYNNASIGPKCKLEVGMVLHIIEDTRVVNSSYRIVWEVL